MSNPWLTIPLTDYEGHMASPTVAQADLLADELERALRLHVPESVAVLGCASGNGFDRIDSTVTKRVVGIDLNPDYLATARTRFAERMPGLELIVADLQVDEIRAEPVVLVFAALLFEYVEVDRVLPTIRRLLNPGGILVAILQLPSETCDAVTPSPFTSLSQLSGHMRFVPPDEFRQIAGQNGFDIIDSRQATTHAKAFQVLTFRVS